MSEVSDVKYVIEHGWFYLLIFEIFDSFSNHVNSTVKYRKLVKTFQKVIVLTPLQPTVCIFSTLFFKEYFISKFSQNSVPMVTIKERIVIKSWL